jgi:predicted nucleic acid-binding protein
VRRCVPDASVLLKWVLPSGEPDSRAALKLRDQAVAGRIELIVPPLWLYEVGNTLGRRHPDIADAALEALELFGLTVCPPSAAWRRRALELMHVYSVTFYDASYHALALIEDAVFVTADRRYVERAGGAGAVTALA